MIATLTGTVTEKLGSIVVLDVRGVGYGLLVTNEDFGSLVSGQSFKVYIHEHIREQSHDLFGFCRLDTMQLFELLLTVNGVGPKMALSVLSVGNSNDVRAAIATGDVKFIQQASGVGKRVAERIVVDLKDKVGLEGVDLASTGLLQGVSALQQDEAVEALMALGYSPQDAAVSLKDVDPELPVEDRLKLALRSK
jgi:holliday junction DNA helicase RuvA